MFKKLVLLVFSVAVLMPKVLVAEQSVQVVLSRAIILQQEHKFKQSIGLLKNSLQQFPDNRDILMNT